MLDGFAARLIEDGKRLDAYAVLDGAYQPLAFERDALDGSAVGRRSSVAAV